MSKKRLPPGITQNTKGEYCVRPYDRKLKKKGRLFKSTSLSEVIAYKERVEAGQPLSRLQWYGGLLAGGGSLLPGFDPAGRYKLSKWPQTEREFPKHFRIATAMMKGPTTIDELAAASGVERAEVVDFVNANLATGFAEPWREPEPEPEATKSGGLLGRLRGK